MARSAFGHSMNYRSVVVRGRARAVTDPEERRAALRAVVEHAIPGRWDEVRQPSPRELESHRRHRPRPGRVLGQGPQRPSPRPGLRPPAGGLGGRGPAPDGRGRTPSRPRPGGGHRRAAERGPGAAAVPRRPTTADDGVTRTRLTPLLIACFAAVFLIWGSTYLAIRFAIETIPPLAMAGPPLPGRRRPPLPARLPDRRSRPRPPDGGALALGPGHRVAAALRGSNGVITLAEQHVASGLVALLVATVPLWMAAFGHFAGSSGSAAWERRGCRRDWWGSP